jgi:hypothetical protein
LEKIIPLLPHFTKYEVTWTNYEERKSARKYFPSKIPENMEDVTLVVDATPLPIQRCRNDIAEGSEGIWDGAHKIWGTIFFCFFSSNLFDFQSFLFYLK